MSKRKAVITGAGQGMGRAIALHLAESNTHVVLIGRTEAKLQSVADEVTEIGGSATVAPLDVTDSDAVQALAQQMSDDTVDILVNCAGDWLIKPVDETTDEDLDHIFGVNLKAPYQLSRAFLPQLRKSDNASIINIGSITAVEFYGGVTAYTAAKQGLKGLSGSMAAEFKPDLIRVVMLSPSPANTPMRWAASPDIDPNMLVEPETIAEVVTMIVNLPQGITTRNMVLESMKLDLSD